MKNINNNFETEAKNIFLKMTKTKKNNTYKKIELCSDIINLYGENHEQNDMISDAWYYKAVYTGGNHYVSLIETETSDMVESYSIAYKKSMGIAADKITAMELHITIFDFIKKAELFAASMEQKDKCRLLMMKHYRFMIIYFLQNDFHKSMELCGELAKYITTMQNNNNLIDIEPIITSINSDKVKNEIMDKFGDTGLALAKENVKKLKNASKRTDNKPKANKDDSFDDISSSIPQIEYFHIELLSKIVDAIPEKKNLDGWENEINNVNGYYNKALACLKNAIHILLNEDNKEDIRK